jgi:hypothetical protein
MSVGGGDGSDAEGIKCRPIPVAIRNNTEVERGFSSWESACNETL